MKILQVVRQYLPGTGGMETYVSSLSRELSEKGHSSGIATLDRLFSTGERLPAFERIDGIEVTRLRSIGTARYFLAPGVLRLLPRYDIVHIHGVDFFTDLLGTFRKMHRKPVVLSTHGGFFHTAWHSNLKKAYFNSVTRLALRGVDRVLASSPQDQELFRRVSRRVTLVENGIDYRGFSSVTKKFSGKDILFVGRISKNKRVDRLLDALAVLRKTEPEARLVVVGPDWEGLLGDLKIKVSVMGLQGAVVFKGTVSRENLLEELAAARLFVSASEYEAFGLSTVEAMAAGTVPVVNRIQAFADIIEDGRTGFLTDFSDPVRAAGILRSALELPDAQLLELGARARASAARYDWGRKVKEIIDIYQEVLGRS